MREMRRLKGGNAKNEMGMRVWRVSVGIREIWVEMRKIWGIRLPMQGIKVETCGRNDIEY